MDTKARLINSTHVDGRELFVDGTTVVNEATLQTLINEGIDISSRVYVDELSQSIVQYNQFVPKSERLDEKRQIETISTDWNIPDEYKNINVLEKLVERLYEHCTAVHEETNDDYIQVRLHRIQEEYGLFKTLGLIDILRSFLYIINKLQEEKVVWGIGRGSSVSSYVLFLIGVHDIDSVKYDLDITDFLRI